MSNELTIGIIGLYTVVYVIVFFVQKSQIDQTKEINASMKSFMDIFKIDEVKKYVEMKNDRIMMQVEKIISDDEGIKKLMKEATTEKVDEIKEVYVNQMGNQHIEMTNVLFQFVKMIDENDRERFINEKLNSVKHILIPMLDTIEEDDNIDSNEP